MAKPSRPAMRIGALLCVLALAVLFAGCPVRILSNYDEQLDKGVTDLQKAQERVLIDIENNKGGKANFSSYQPFYDDFLASVRALKSRASTDPEGNKLTLEQLSILETKIVAMRTQHHDFGFDVNEAALLRKDFALAFEAILKLEELKKRE